MIPMVGFNECIRTAETMGQLENPPEEGRELLITDGMGIYDLVYFSEGKFVNRFGFELFHIVGWRYK